ncbi:MAG TPA: hypothetical protein VEJ63_12180 [Planctomycetota bacterium]|nr:hypothetical protein [Planctomycetota bacterium]
MVNRRFDFFRCVAALLALAAAGTTFAGEAKTPKSEQVVSSEFAPGDAVGIRSLFYRLADGFTSADHAAIKKLVKASAEERERIEETLQREFRQARYIEFAILDVTPDETLKDKRQTVDVRLRYKLVHPDEAPATPAGQVLELTAADGDSDGHWLEIPIQAPSAGRYEVFLAAADLRAWLPPRRLSPFAWKIDDAPEQPAPPAESAVYEEELQSLGTVELKEGAHTFKLRLTDRREEPDTQYAFWIDAVVLRRKIAPPETSRASLVFEAESGRWSSAWKATPYIENRVTETFAIQKLDDGTFMLVGSEFFDALGLRQGLGGVMVDAVFAAMIFGACLVFWVWMGYEVYRARPRYTFWRIAVLIPIVGPLAFFVFGYLPRLLRGALARG